MSHIIWVILKSQCDEGVKYASLKVYSTLDHLHFEPRLTDSLLNSVHKNLKPHTIWPIHFRRNSELSESGGLTPPIETFT